MFPFTQSRLNHSGKTLWPTSILYNCLTHSTKRCIEPALPLLSPATLIEMVMTCVPRGDPRFLNPSLAASWSATWMAGPRKVGWFNGKTHESWALANQILTIQGQICGNCWLQPCEIPRYCKVNGQTRSTKTQACGQESARAAELSIVVPSVAETPKSNAALSTPLGKGSQLR